MNLREPQAAGLDGDALYRIDDVGTRAVVVPATCRRRVHRLARVGYRITEADGLLRVRCDACLVAGEAAHTWLLRSSDPAATVAELDDAPYGISR